MATLFLMTLLLLFGASRAQGQSDLATSTPDAGSGSVARPVSADVSRLDQAWDSPEVAAPRFDERPLRRTDDSPPVGKPLATGPVRGNSASWLRTGLALGGVVALIFMLSWGYRSFNGGRTGLTGRPRRPGVVQIISRVTLAPRQSLCLVRVGPRMVLVGQTHERLTTLDVIQDEDLTARLCGDAASQQPDSGSAAFENILRHEARAFDEATGAAPVAPEDADPKLEALKRQLAGTLDRIRSKVQRA